MRKTIWTVIGLLLASAVAMAPASTPSASVATKTPKPVFGVKVQDGKLVSTLDGQPVQLRGANYSSMETPADGPVGPVIPTNLSVKASADIIQGYSNANLGKYPWWSVPKSWKMNVIRIPLNEASWLRDYTGVDILGDLREKRQPDSSGNLRAAVKQMVSDLVAAGFYVILDLHWTAPGPYLASVQAGLPDADHSIAFWTSVARDFGNNPAVIFDLFNEPYPGGPNFKISEADAFRLLINGGHQDIIDFDSGRKKIPYSWESAGMQAMVDAVRAAGATNVLMIAGICGASDLSGFTAAGGHFFPRDPLNNLAASWHAYGVKGPDYTMKNGSFTGTINPTTVANTLIAEGIPVIVGEAGDKSSNGTTDAPSIRYLTGWADQHGASVLAWTWNLWNDRDGNPGKENQLIKDALGTPTDGEGVAFKQWLSRH